MKAIQSNEQKTLRRNQISICLTLTEIVKTKST